MKKCKSCDIFIELKGKGCRRRLFCNKECKRSYYNSIKIGRNGTLCLNCNTELVQNERESNNDFLKRKYCGANCVSCSKSEFPKEDAVCKKCNKPLLRRSREAVETFNNRIYCGAKCNEGLQRRQKEKSLTGEESFYKSYIRKAAKRSIVFDLTLLEFQSLIRSYCFYCNRAPLVRNRFGNVNGVDRLDNNLGYNKYNCVAACKLCNIAKLDMSLVEFTEWIRRFLASTENLLTRIEENRCVSIPDIDLVDALRRLSGSEFVTRQKAATLIRCHLVTINRAIENDELLFVNDAISIESLAQWAPTYKCWRYSSVMDISDNDSFMLEYLYRRVKIQSNHDGVDFQLSLPEYFKLIKGNCFYCGIKPEDIKKRHSHKMLTNGIDRLDSKIGYILKNCVSACFRCNSAKNTLSIEDLIEWRKMLLQNGVVEKIKAYLSSEKFPPLSVATF